MSQYTYIMDIYIIFILYFKYNMISFNQNFVYMKKITKPGCLTY